MKKFHLLLLAIVIVNVSLFTFSQPAFSSDQYGSAQQIQLADDDSADTTQMWVNGLKQIANSTQCTGNCNARNSSCLMRCRRYKNNDPEGVACVMDCNTDYNQCTQSCQNQ